MYISCESPFFILILDLLLAQNVKIMNVQAEQQVMTKLFVKQEEANANLKSAFPVLTVEDFTVLDNKINSDNKSLYVSLYQK